MMDDTREVSPEGIAIIGMAGRFPGAADLERFWRNLRDGVESISFLSREELLAAGVEAVLLDDPRFVPAGGMLPGIELFDAPFFGFGPREAEIMDPQQRVFLECAWEALESAGYDTEVYSGSIGIFGGMGMSQYLLRNLISHPDVLAAAGPLQVRIFNDKDFLVSLAAFKLGLTGPSINVQTACSTSLVATCLACQSLLSFQCDMALAGGVTIALPQAGYLPLDGISSPDGHCRAFDAGSQGTVGGSGAGIVVLKRLADAIEDGDTIRAVIKGSATNNDGSLKVGYTAPGVEGQIEVVAMAQAVAGIRGDTITYVEAHGTGTPLGDPIEVEGLTEVFRAATERTGFCGLGSVKTNIGHLDTAAGVASLIKAVLAMEHRVIPPSLGFERPNPQIEWESTPFYVPTEAREWRTDGVPRRAGVSSFAIGGINAHLVVEEAPALAPPGPAPPWHLLVLSARTETALERATENLVRHLRELPETGRAGGTPALPGFADVVYTLQAGRRSFSYRRAVVCRDREEAVAALEARRFLDGAGEPGEETIEPEPVTAMRDPRAELTALGRRWLSGARIEWSALWAGQRRRRVPLPTYPFERQRYWIEPASQPAPAVPDASPLSRLSRPKAGEGRRERGKGGEVRPRPRLPNPYVEPRDERERFVAEAMRELLGLDRVGLYDSLFDLGGDSLMATRLVSRLNETLGTDLTLKSVFEGPTAADLALRGTAPAQDPLERIERIERADRIERLPRDGRPLPLSFAQRRLWFLDQLAPGDPFYNVPGAAELLGPFDPAVLARCFEEIVRRHETLRTTFASVDGEPFQVVGEPGPWTLPVADLGALPEGAARTELERLVREEARRPFDLARGPLLRTLLLRLEEERHALLLTLHHIVTDGWSHAVLLREMSTLYDAFSAGLPSPLPDLPVQYADFAAWQLGRLEGGLLAGQLAWWKESLGDLPPALDLPADRPRPAVQGFQGAQLPLRISSYLTEALRRLGREEGATLFMTLLAALEALLFRHTGQEDFAVGVPVANRTRTEVEGLIGFFTNTLVLRARPAGEESFRELLRRVRDTAREAFLRQDIPFEMLVEELQPRRDLSRSPLFQVMLVSTPMDESRLPERVRGLGIDPGVARFDLLFDLSETGGGLSGFLEFNTGLFDHTTAERMGRRLEVLLEGIAEDADRSLWELPVLPEEEWREVVALPSPGRGGERSVLDLVQAQASLTPDAPAIIGFDGEEVTYRELVQRARRLAWHLRGLGVVPGTRVALSFERSPGALVAILAVLEAGGAYVPIDPGYPEERRTFMREDSGAVVLLDRERMRALEASEDAPDGHPPGEIWPDHPAYVLYTSGSTGWPKGVAMTHGALANLIAWQVGDLPGPSRTLQLTSLSFDVSFQEIFSTWASGGALVLVSEEQRRDPAALLAVLRERGVERLFLPFVALQQLAEAAEGEDRLPESLREVVTAGEQLRITPAIAALFRRLPGARLHNHYGPTEAHVVTAWALQGDPAAWPALPPIGRPISGARALVLDPAGGPAPVGIPGELFLGGVCLARGYLDRPDLTAERFVPDPFSGFRDEPGARLYRTGDRARWRSDGGGLEYLGRLDAQVKVRGYRVEPGEVEAALAACPGVAEAVVGVREAGEGDRRLIAWVVPKEGEVPGTADLRALLASRLPEHEVPSAIVLIDALPLTPSGKIDRRRLAGLVPDPGPVEPSGGEAPRTPAEEMLAGVWAEVLGLPRVGVRDDFFALGGHSLLATRVAARVRTSFGVSLPVRTLFEAPTVEALAQRIESLRRQDRGITAPPLVRVDRTRPLPLSFAQERIWFLEQLQPGTPTYNVPVAVDLRGALRTEALAAALEEVLHRHEPLRTGFRTIGGRPVQEVRPAGSIPLPLVDLREIPEEARLAEAGRLAGLWARRPFDLQSGFLLTAALLRLGDDGHRLLLGMHHIASDGWSIGVLVREISILYTVLAQGGAVWPAQAAGSAAGAHTKEPSTARPFPSLPALPVQYGDFAVWQREWLRGEVLDRLLAAWRQRLAGAPPATELPADRPHPSVQGSRGGNVPVHIGKETSAALTALARAAGATPFMVLLAVFQALLQRLGGQDDIVVGTPVAGRGREELEGLIGVFVNALPLRTDLSGRPSFRELLGRVREVALDAYALQDLPFEKLVEELKPVRDLSRSPVFQTMLILQNAPLGALELPGLVLEPRPVDNGTAKFELLLSLVEEKDGLTGTLEHSADLFDRATAERVARWFGVLLRAAVGEPGRPVRRLPLLSAEEREQLLSVWSRGAALGPSEACLHELFEARAEASPGAVALSWTLSGSTGELTYGELAARSRRLARHLRELGVGPEVRVGICLERSPEMVVAVLAVLQAGGAYVPMDPAHPAARLAHMVEDTGMPVLVARRETATALPLQGVRVVDPGEEREETGRRDASRLSPAAVPESLAYVIYTSGSTGVPKGVAITHRSAVALLRWTRDAFRPEELAAVLASTSLTFDLSVFELFAPLAAGGRIVLVENALQLVDMAEREREGITLINTVPSAMTELVRMKALPASVRVAALAGEPLRRRLAGDLHRLGVPRVLNLYGPSEDTTYSTFAEVGSGKVAEPSEPAIGRPVAGSRAYLVDRELEPAPAGVPGEICLAGEGLARGYPGRPDLTAERFLPDPFSEGGERLYRTGDLGRWRPDGEIEFLGRLDHQVKVRGFRIELGEIEAALLRGPEVAEAAVVVQEDGGGRRLVACVVPAPGAGEIDLAGLRSALRTRLPEPMVPSAFAVLPALPLTPNGKVDRRALAAAVAVPARMARVEKVAPRTPLEAWLVETCTDLLALEGIGLQDNFFELGGHSLLATQLVVRLREAWKVDLPLRVVFEAADLASLADRITEWTLLAADDQELAEVLSELDGVSPEELKLLLSREG